MAPKSRFGIIVAASVIASISCPPAHAQLFHFGSSRSVRQSEQQRMVEERTHRAGTQKTFMSPQRFYLKDLVRSFIDKVRRSMEILKVRRRNAAVVRHQVRTRMRQVREQQRAQRQRQRTLRMAQEDRLRDLKDRTRMLAQRQQSLMDNMRARRR